MTSIVHSPAASQVMTQVSVQVYVRPALTARQVQVVQFILDGWTYKQIASKLGISIGTVKHHVKAAILRTGVDNRMQLITHALSVGAVAYTFR